VGSDEAKMAVMVMATETREVMTIEQVAEYLQIEPDDVRRLIDARGLRAFEVADGELRVPFEELQRWVKRSVAEAAEPSANSIGMTPEEMREARQGPATGRVPVANNLPPLTQAFLDRVTATREAILAERGGKPFPKGWIREAIDEGRL